MRISDWSSDVCSSDLYPEFDVVWFGHVGDGNLHINVLRPEGMDGAEFVGQCEQVTNLLAETLQRHGGSISAELGIALVQTAYLSPTRSEEELEVMRGIRRALDQHGILDPGKLLDPCRDRTRPRLTTSNSCAH